MPAKNCVDPIFKKYFGIETSITYSEKVTIQKKVEQKFYRSWNRFYKKAEPIISNFRAERFDAFFRQLKTDGCAERYNHRVEIRFINSVVGYGVFAKENIPPYSTLIHYAGLLMLDAEIPANQDSTFSFTDYKTYSINAAKEGNWSRFMNHCAEGEEGNNAIPWEHYTPEGPRIVFTTSSCGIKAGRQILYSYGDDYWTDQKCFKL